MLWKFRPRGQRTGEHLCNVCKRLAGKFQLSIHYCTRVHNYHTLSLNFRQPTTSVVSYLRRIVA